jgi:hypothetical protein
MSVLDDFARIRLFRERASEFAWLADNATLPSVQRRYRTIARHYKQLADRDERSDRADMARRLEGLKQQRRDQPLSKMANQSFLILRGERPTPFKRPINLLAAE